jgi:hypothetical protein
MLLNLSNHPSTNWGEKQKQQALEKYGSISDMAFPNVAPELNEAELTDLVQKYVEQIIKLKPNAVHIMGEMNFVFKCVTLLKSYGLDCLASTTERKVVEHGNEKITMFEFVQFRFY